MNPKDATTTVDLNTLMAECYSRAFKYGGEFVTVETLVDAVYCALDPGLTAPIEIQRLALQQLDELAMKFCQKRNDGRYYRIFDDEAFCWTGKWTESEFVSYHVRTYEMRELVN